MPTTFDPTKRRETWLFQQIGQQPKGKPVYRCLSYVLVSYDGDPQSFIEPTPADETICVLADGGATQNGGKRIDPAADGLGRVSDFQFFAARPFEVHAFNDVDAANNIGQLP